MLGQGSGHEESRWVGEAEGQADQGSARWRAIEKWATDFITKQRTDLNRMVRSTVAHLVVRCEKNLALQLTESKYFASPCRNIELVSCGLLRRFRRRNTSTGSANAENVKPCYRCQPRALSEQTRGTCLNPAGKNSNEGTFQVGCLQGRMLRCRRTTLHLQRTPYPWTSMMPRAWSATAWTMIQTCCFVTAVTTDTTYIAVPRS